MVEKRTVLGRGISSLIPTGFKPAEQRSAEAGQDLAGEKSIFVEIERIRMNPRQPRKNFSEKSLHELELSVKEKGILQPLLVCRKGMHYELIAGERRYRAAQQAGLSSVPVRVLETDDQGQLEIALIENLIREDLNPIEEAKGYEKLQKEFGMTHEQISQKVSKDRSTITNALRLLKLPLAVQQEINRGNLTMGHARALLSLEQESLQLKLAQDVLTQGLSVRQTEYQAGQIVQPGRPAKVPAQENPNLQFIREEIQRKLGTKVEIKQRAKGKGEIRIQYFNPEDLNRILTQLNR